MGVLKNDVGRPSNKTIMIRRILKVILILIVVLLAVTLGGYIKDKGNNKTNEKSNAKVSESKEKRAISNDDAEKIITRIFGEDYDFPIGNMDIESYNDKSYQMIIAIEKTKKDSTKDYNLNYEFGNVIYYDENDNLVFDSPDGFRYYYQGVIYSYNSVNEVYKSFFGNKKEALKQDILFDFTGYLYSKKDDIFVQFNPIWGDGGHQPISDIIETKLKNNLLYITIARGDASYNGENDWSLPLIDGTEVKLTNAEIENKGTCEKYKDKLEKYEFKFTLEDDVYKFVSVEKIK